MWYLPKNRLWTKTAPETKSLLYQAQKERVFFSSPAILGKYTVLFHLLPNWVKLEARDKARNPLLVFCTTEGNSRGKNKKGTQARVLCSHMARARWRPIRTRIRTVGVSESPGIHNCSSPGAWNKEGRGGGSITPANLLGLEKRERKKKQRAVQTGHRSDHMSCVMLPLKEGANIFQRAAQKCIALAVLAVFTRRREEYPAYSCACLWIFFFKSKVQVDSLRQLNSYSLPSENQWSKVRWVLEWRCSFLWAQTLCTLF